MKNRALAAVMAATMILSAIAGCGSKSANEAADTETSVEAEAQESVEETSEEATEETSEEASEETQEENAASDAAIEDGVYSAKFTTDSSMFHINEAYGDRGTLTVKDGEMIIHITLPSQNVVNLFPGTAEDAQKDGAELLQPTTDTVTYDDGTTEEVYGFDVPVPAIDEPFQLALIGTKGKWYDHKVKVSL